jgi:uncharacterized protein YqgQ
MSKTMFHAGKSSPLLGVFPCRAHSCHRINPTHEAPENALNVPNFDLTCRSTDRRHEGLKTEIEFAKEEIPKLFRQYLLSRNRQLRAKPHMAEILAAKARQELAFVTILSSKLGFLCC